MYGSQTHPDYWHDAENFLPERWLDSAYPEPTLDAYYPFSAGYVRGYKIDFICVNT